MIFPFWHLVDAMFRRVRRLVKKTMTWQFRPNVVPDYFFRPNVVLDEMSHRPKVVCDQLSYRRNGFRRIVVHPAIDCCTAIWGMSGLCILWTVCFTIRSTDGVIMRPLHFLCHISSNISHFLDRVCLYNLWISLITKFSTTTGTKEKIGVFIRLYYQETITISKMI